MLTQPDSKVSAVQSGGVGLNWGVYGSVTAVNLTRKTTATTTPSRDVTVY